MLTLSTYLQWLCVQVCSRDNKNADACNAYKIYVIVVGVSTSTYAVI